MEALRHNPNNALERTSVARGYEVVNVMPPVNSSARRTVQLTLRAAPKGVSMSGSDYHHDDHIILTMTIRNKKVCHTHRKTISTDFKSPLHDNLQLVRVQSPTPTPTQDNASDPPIPSIPSNNLPIRPIRPIRQRMNVQPMHMVLY